jgi:hypothetical protein
MGLHPYQQAMCPPSALRAPAFERTILAVPSAQAEAVLAMAQEIDVQELEQAKIIIAKRTPRTGPARYGRI